MHHYNYSQPNRNIITKSQNTGKNAACMHTLRRHMHRQAGANCTDAKLYFWTIFQFLFYPNGTTHPLTNYVWIFGFFFIFAKPLRSAGSALLCVPRHNLERYGRRSFSCAGPVLWNSLPEGMRLAESLNSFKSHLKTHYFKLAYNL